MEKWFGKSLDKSGQLQGRIYWSTLGLVERNLITWICNQNLKKIILKNQPPVGVISQNGVITLRVAMVWKRFFLQIYIKWFLDASSHLYERVGPSIGPSVSVRWSRFRKNGQNWLKFEYETYIEKKLGYFYTCRCKLERSRPNNFRLMIFSKKNFLKKSFF